MTATPKRPTLNRARAIREFCCECMGYALHEVNRCTDLPCPLWEWRRGPGGPERSETLLRRQAGTGTPPTPAAPVLALKNRADKAISDNNEEHRPRPTGPPATPEQNGEILRSHRL
jgi:hypothetical protein